MIQTTLSVAALLIAALAYYRATRRELPNVYLFARSEDAFDPQWRIRIQNPTSLPIHLLYIGINAPAEERVSFYHPAITLRGGIERISDELSETESGAGPRYRRHIHLAVHPGATEDLELTVKAQQDDKGDPEPYSLNLDLDWSHRLPFPEAHVFRLLHQNLIKTPLDLKRLRLAARPPEVD